MRLACQAAPAREAKMSRLSNEKKFSYVAERHRGNTGTPFSCANLFFCSLWPWMARQCGVITNTESFIFNVSRLRTAVIYDRL